MTTEDASTQRKRRAFVSHSSADDSFVAELESFLRASGFDDVFNDVHAIKPDEQFWPKIEEGVRNCDIFYVVITAASNNSDWVSREIKFARQIGKQVVPVWREDCPLPTEFTDRDVIDFRLRRRQERRFDISRILKYAPEELIGRGEETKLLNDAWQNVLRLAKPRPHVLTFVALGGEGKTSLAAKWAADLAAQDWPGCDAAFAWSFYSQGSSETQASSSDLFLKEALNFFAMGDPKEEEIKAFAASPAGAYEKGQRLAHLVGQRRTLLILDGLEPLQYAPSSPTSGELKDQGIAALLKGLAQNSHGFCLVTTRYSVSDLKAFWKSTAPEVKLLRLSREAGVHLLKNLGVKGSELCNILFSDGKEKLNDFEKLVEDVKGHALTLTLLGGFLKRAFHGDIRQRDLVKFEKADEKMDGGHAFRTMAAYEQWLLRDGGVEGQREVAVLRLMGLFDRPADAGCLAALREEIIPGFTEPLAVLDEDDWEYCLSGLEVARLLTVNRNAAGALVSLDTHPHIREYFAKQLREQHPDAWRAGHKRLYEHLCKHKEGDQPTLEDLQPLYQAVAHGCQAGLQQEVCDKVYRDRIYRGQENYVANNLGAFGAETSGIACFFEQPWNCLSPSLSEAAQGWLLAVAAFGLRAHGRLVEALNPMRAGLSIQIKWSDWKNAAISTNNLSELELMLGEVVDAISDAKQSVTYANRNGEWGQKMGCLTGHADALHQAGRWVEAEMIFREAEHLQQEMQPDYSLLYSVQGFHYCDLLLAVSERAAWQMMLKLRVRNLESELIKVCHEVEKHVAQTLKWVMTQNWLLDIALDHLTLGRATLYESILKKTDVQKATSEVEQAMSGLRRAGVQDYFLHGLLTRAWFLAVTNDYAGAQADLDEAREIAERGPMRLFMADIHLYRARLFFREKKYPWESPEADLNAAEKLINDCGYHRRDEELADAKRAILGR